MPKYSSYIEISPLYESVVDMDAEERNPDLWREYIVHDDMKNAVDKICQSVKEETKDARRSFWIHGAYGTGKSYAALVLKHLFEDSLDNVEDFFSRHHNNLLSYRNKFLSIREKGEFLVIWKSGCTGIKDGIHLMMEMEIAVREKLKQKFGDKAYYGSRSLVSSVKERLKDKTINWDYIFKSQEYALFEDYESFDELCSDIEENNLKATDRVAKIIMEKGWGLFDNVEQFQDWIKEIISGNNLINTGIVFIWDEFTGFLRDCGDDNVLQRLSEYCKQQPFYMCLIVHRDPGWVGNMGEETYRRIMHRYHELEFHISESAAYDLIGNSILVRQGMTEQWDSIKNTLMSSIQSNIADFDNLEMSSGRERFAQLCPLHPMTLSMLAIVAQNFGASQRTLFRFMKDANEANEKVGFIHYINNYGPDDWRWLTPDFLWNYFFTRESDMKDMSSDARKCYQHFVDKKDFAGEETGLHVFKSILLLIAIMTTGKTTHLYSKLNNNRISPTKKCLYLCLSGQLKEKDVDKYLDVFEANGLIRIDRKSGGDMRLELPYTGNADVFSIRLEEIQKKYTRNSVLSKKGEFSDLLEKRFWGEDDPTSKRIIVRVSSSEGRQIDYRRKELADELSKNPYKIGVLLVVLKDQSEYQTIQTKLKDCNTVDRLVSCVTKEPLTENILGEWHQLIVKKELSAEEGKQGSSNNYENQAELLLSKWVETAISSQITGFYNDQVITSWGKDELIRRLKEKVIFEIFKAAPELIVATSTAFRTANDSAALAGIQGDTKSSQIKNILTPLRQAQVYSVTSLEELCQIKGDSAAVEAIRELASYLNSLLSKGLRIHLDQIWEDLQQEPFGYYSSLACGAILGSALRFYTNSQYYWIDETNNTHILTDQNMASMILKLCKGQVAGNTLSCGSETWQKFKEYVKNIFSLSDDDVVSEEQARKFMREKIVNTGLPFWVMKYLEESSLGGLDSKKRACEIIDNIVVFMKGTENINDSMDKVNELFSGSGVLRKNISDAFKDKEKLFEAFRSFVIDAHPSIESLTNDIGINSSDLYSHIKQTLQEAVYTWSEEDVKSKLDGLSWEYELLSILNKSIRATCKSIPSAREILSNCFNFMKIPGSVLEKSDKDWAPALRMLHLVSTGNIPSAPEERTLFLDKLRNHGASAWEHVSDSKNLLKDLINSKGVSCSEQELETIFSSLKTVPYDSPESLFQDIISQQLNNIEFGRNKDELLSIWNKISSTDSIYEWCKRYSTPIQWVIPDESIEHFNLLKLIQDNKKVDEKDLRKTLSFFRDFEKTPPSYLRDQQYIQRKFFAQAGVDHEEIFILNRDHILIDIRNNLGVDVYDWAMKSTTISTIIGNFTKKKLKEKHLQEAHARVTSMGESELKDRLISLLNEHPELCEFFIKQ